MNDSVFVVGHKNPDSDSICSALAYAHMKNECGVPAIACRLGPLNEETKYVLKRFNIENPLLIKDARSQLKDIEIDEAVLIKKDATVNEAWSKMLTTKSRSLVVVDDDNHLEGILTTSNLSSIRLLSMQELFDLMKTVTVTALAKTIKGTVLVNPTSFKTNGQTYVITLRKNEDLTEDFKDSICLLSDSDSKQRELIEKGAKCLVITCGKTVSPIVKQMAQAYSCAIIMTNFDTMQTARVIDESFSIEHIMTKDVVTFRDNEYVDDVAAKMMKSRVRSYPVLDKEGNVVGCVARFHTINYKKKHFILVDHSAKNQAISHIEDAIIDEIVDHHHVGNIETDYPIDYRNKRCGCTASIVSMLYQENGLLPDAQMSGLLLSAIISDTLNFKSATTTDFDRNTAIWLADRAGIEDISKYAEEMLAASVSLKNSSPEEILNRDLKDYNVGQYHFAIGQTNYNRLEEVQALLPEFKELVLNEQRKGKYDLLVMMFTHVLAEGTLFVFYGPLSYVMKDILETKFDDHSGYDKEIISRKQQMMPKLSEALKNI